MFWLRLDFSLANYIASKNIGERFCVPIHIASKNIRIYFAFCHTISSVVRPSLRPSLRLLTITMGRYLLRNYWCQSSETSHIESPWCLVGPNWNSCWSKIQDGRQAAILNFQKFDTYLINE